MEQKIKKLILTKEGMFSNIDLVITHLYLAELNNYKFIIEWDKCAYSNISNIDAWNLFFEDCFDIPNKIEYKKVILTNTEKQNSIITPRYCFKVNKKLRRLMLLPKDRELCHYYIKKYIKLKPHIQKRINDFKNKYFQGNILGVHIRGPGRLNNSTSKFIKRYCNLSYDVPFDLYLKHIDKYLQEHSNTKLFICSDSKYVLTKLVLRYQDKALIYNWDKSNYGEMHKKKKNFKYKLGEDVLVETYLLSESNFFIHGNSSISNFILGKNPNLKHIYIYKDIEKQMRKDYKQKIF